jgi:hypothetical protein
MLKKLKRLVIILTIVFPFINFTTIAEESSKRSYFVKPDDIAMEKAVDRARQTVKMIDDLYKTFIVLITEEYVKDPKMFSAATLSKMVFEIMSKKGWHVARLLSASDVPLNPDNIPKDDFERDAMKAIVSGKTYYEKVIMIDNEIYLMAATSVPVVVPGCMICHPDKRVGDLIGAISYRIPLDVYF